MQRMTKFKIYQYIFLLGLLIGFVLYSKVLNFHLLRPSRSEVADCTCPAAPTSKDIILQHHEETTTISSRNVNVISSLCSKKATLMGLGQKVISFSLFIKDKSSKHNVDYVKLRCASNLRGCLNKTREFYPGWLMRVYTDIYDDVGFGDFFESLLKENDFFICNITKLLKLGDPTVSIFISRDLDSLIGSIERSAVKQWEESNKIFHAMRDNPNHKVPVLAGMWGAKNYLLSSPMRQAFLAVFLEVPIQKGKNEQHLLEISIYTFCKSDFMIHASYFCNYFNDSIPFPEQRTDLVHYVAAFNGPYWGRLTKTVSKCPIECRPKHGSNWTYC